jgi:hypothetical protein
MRSISRLLLQRVMAVYLLLTLSLLVVECVSAYQKLRSEVLAELVMVQDAFRENVRLALWNMNNSQVDASLDSIRHMPSVTRVIVTAPDGRVLRDAPGLGDNKSGIALLPVTHYVSRSEVLSPGAVPGSLLGYLEIQSSSHVLVHRITGTLLLAIARVLTGSLLILWLVKVNFDRMLTRPLLKVARRAEAVRPHGHNEPLPLGSGPPNELDVISAAINNLVAEMAETLASLDALNRGLESTVASRTEALQQTNKELVQSMEELEATQASLKAATEAKS